MKISHRSPGQVQVIRERNEKIVADLFRGRNLKKKSFCILVARLRGLDSKFWNGRKLGNDMRQAQTMGSVL